MCGGCGYIEEWFDARILRDAHLGSIWEGTSNIVALDVIRAARREGALEALLDYLSTCPDGCDPALAARITAALDRAAALTRSAAEGAEADTRLAASALYHAASAAFMAWEAAQLTDPDIARDRATLAGMVLTHRLEPADPLAPAAPAGLSGMLERAGIDTEPTPEGAAT